MSTARVPREYPLQSSDGMSLLAGSKSTERGCTTRSWGRSIIRTLSGITRTLGGITRTLKTIIRTLSGITRTLKTIIRSLSGITRTLQTIAANKTAVCRPCSGAVRCARGEPMQRCSPVWAG